MQDPVKTDKSETRKVEVEGEDDGTLKLRADHSFVQSQETATGGGGDILEKTKLSGKHERTGHVPL